jgi:hypothetical protein
MSEIRNWLESIVRVAQTHDLEGLALTSHGREGLEPRRSRQEFKHLAFRARFP